VNSIKKWLINPWITGITYALWLVLVGIAISFIWIIASPFFINGSWQARIFVFFLFTFMFSAIMLFGYAHAALTQRKLSFLSSIGITLIALISLCMLHFLLSMWETKTIPPYIDRFELFFLFIYLIIMMIICPILFFAGQRLYFALKR
jgi:hypothetical protein